MRIRPKKPKAALRSNFRRGIYRCVGGPLDGKNISLDTCGDLKTFAFRLRGEIGRYVGANWQPIA